MSTALQKTDDKGMAAYVPFGSDLPIKLSVKIVQSLVSVKTRQGHVAGERDCLKFIAMCQAQKLNPFAGDAYLIGYDSDQGPTFSLITAHQAFLKRAEVSPDYDGMESGVIVFDEASQQVKEIQGDFYEKDQIVIGGWAKVYHKRRKIPTYRRLRVERFDTHKAQWKDDAAGMICKCFDEQTEVLTTRGFEKFTNAEGNVLEVTDFGLQPTGCVPFFKPYEGNMVEFTSRNGNFRVTPNHDMPIAFSGSPEMRMEAGELLKIKQRDVATMPLTITGTHNEHPVDDTTIQLIAAYIADGSDNSCGAGFSISVSRKDKVDRLMELGRHTSCAERKVAGQKATLSTGRVITTKADKKVFYYSRSVSFSEIVGRGKVINHDTVLCLSMRQARLLLDTWIAFDGNKPKNLRCGRIYSSRLEHLAAIELLAVIAGYSVNKATERESEGGKTNYYLTITDRTTTRICKSEVKEVKNEGTGVWCVTVPSHKIVVRRNGFSHVCYQCAEADALRATFPTMLGGLYHEGERNLGTAIEVGTVLADEPQQSPGPQPVIENGPNVQAQTSPSPTQPTAPAPQPVVDNEPTPQMKLAAWAIDQGYNFDQFVQWGKLTSNIRRDFAGTSFDDLPTAECKRWIRATDSILSKMRTLGDALNA